MGAKLHKQFQDFHDAIKLDKESSLLKEKRDTLQSDIEKKLPDKLGDIGVDIQKKDLPLRLAVCLLDMKMLKQAISQWQMLLNHSP